MLDIKTIMQNCEKYNGKDLCLSIYGLDPNTEYDALVIAPGWKLSNMVMSKNIDVYNLVQAVYYSSFEATFFVDNKPVNIAWVQCAAGASNLIDTILTCSTANFKNLVFTGAVGGLTEDIAVGELYTPRYCIEGTNTTEYLKEKLEFAKNGCRRIQNNQKYVNELQSVFPEIQTSDVFCTDSIVLEYSHLDEIKNTGAKLIEMETATFIQTAELIGKPYYVLLNVSDNSAKKESLVYKTEQNGKQYITTKNSIPEKIVKLITTKNSEKKD